MLARFLITTLIDGRNEVENRYFYSKTCKNWRDMLRNRSKDIIITDRCEHLILSKKKVSLYKISNNFECMYLNEHKKFAA